MSTASNIMTADQLLADGGRLGRCELIHGELRMMSPAGGEHGKIAARLARWIGNEAERIGGEGFAAETGFILKRNPDTVRAPDVAYIAADRVEQTRTTKFIPIPPDFCAEVVSPCDTADAVIAKAQWWLDHGVKLVWVVDPPTRSVTAYLPGGDAHVYRNDDAPNLAPVLPELTIALPKLFA